MGKRRLVQSEDGSYGVYDPISKNVIELPSSSKLVKSNDGSYGIFSNGKVEELDSFAPKKKEDTGLSGETSSTGGGFNFEKKASQLEELGITKPTTVSAEDLESPRINVERNKAIDEYNKKAAERATLDSVVRFGLAPALDSGGLSKGFAAGISSAAKNVFGLLEGGTALLSNYVFETDEAKKRLDVTAKDFNDLAMKAGQIDKSLTNQIKRESGFSEEDLDKGFVDLYKEGKLGMNKALALGSIGTMEALPQIIVAAAAAPETGTVLAARATTFATSALSSLGSQLAEESAASGGLNKVGVAKAFFKAGIEGLTEAIGLKDITAAKTAIQAFDKAALESLEGMIEKEGKDAVKEQVVRSFTGLFNKAGGTTAVAESVKGGLQEGFEEAVSTVGSFIVDRVADGKWKSADYARLVNDVVDSSVLGFATGGAISSVAASASITPLDEAQKNKISKLNEIYLDASLSEDVRDIAKAQINDIVKFNADKTGTLYNDITSLPRDKRADALDLTRRIKNLEEDKVEVRDIETQNAIDSSIESLTTTRQSIFDSYKEEISTSASNLEALVQGDKFEVQSDKPYVFTFKADEELPESLKGVEPASTLNVSYGGSYNAGGTLSTRYTFSGKDLIEAGVAKEATPAQVATEEIKQQENEGQPIAQEPITAEETTVINNAVSNVVRIQAEKQAEAKPAGLKGRAYEKILDLEDSTPEALAIKFFASGGKVLKETPKDYTGAKRKTLAGLFTTPKQGGDIVSKEELKSRSSISGNEASGALSIDAIAEKLWKQSGARQEDKGDYLSAVESVLTGFSNKTQMANYLLEKNKVEKATGIQLGEDFENQRMQYEADRLGMTMEEFQDYIDNNVDYQEARDEAMDETQDILNNIQDYPELFASMGLSQEEIDDINNLFAEEAFPQEEDAQKEAAPDEPTIPPTPPTEPPVEEKPMGEDLPDEIKEAREVYESKMSELAKESLTKKKSLLSRLPEMLYDSKFKARRAINALDKYSLAGARLQTLLGINKKIAERLTKIESKIYDDANINDEKIMDVAIFNKRVIQLDKKREAKRASEQERLTENFVKKNNSQPNESELKSIVAASKAKFPKLSHGTRMLNGKIVPMTSEIAEQSLVKMEQQLGEKAFNRIMSKVELYKKANNELVKELYDNGSITKEVYDDYVDDFYAMRQTIDAFFESFSEQDKNLHASAAKAWNAISKTGATNTLMLDSRALLAMSYSATIRNLQKNKFKQSLYDETIGADANVNWAKPANIKTKKLGAEAGKVLLDKKGEQVLPADKGFKNISFMQEGKVKHFQVDEDIYDQLEGLNQVFRNAPIEDGVLINLNDYRNRLLTGFATRYNPTFFWRNAALDLTHQVVFTDIWGKNGNVFSSGLRAMYNTFRMMDVINSRKGERQDNLAEFIEAGGHMDLLSASSESKKQLYEQQRAAAQGKDYINVDSKKGKIGAVLGFVNERLELGMRLAAYNQVKKTTEAEFIKRNDGKPLSNSQKLQVNEIAAAQARGYTDFAQKGTWLPYKVNIPYMNAAFQTFGKSMEYIADNPKSFVWKMSQIGSINFMWTLALMTLMGDDYWDISEYDRDNILVPVPYSRDVIKEEDGKEKGEWNLAKFGVHNTLIPYFRATRFAAEKVHGIITGKTRETDAMETFDGAIDGINKALPLPVIFATPKQAEASLRGVISKDLWMNAAMKAYTGYDIFRNRDIVTEQERKGEFKEEGMLNKQVPYIYKAVGNSIGFSPARLQAVGETFYTSPSTNLLIAGAYDLTSDMANWVKPAQSDKERGLYTMSDPDKLMQSLTKRFIVKTDPEYAAKQRNKKINEKAEELAQEAYSQELNVKNKIKEAREKYKGEENSWELIKSEVLPFVEKNADIVDKQRTLSLMRSANKAGKAKEAISDVIEQRAYSLRYSPTVNSKAELLMEMTNGDKAKADELLDAAQDAGLNGSERFKVLKRYNELVKPQKND